MQSSNTFMVISGSISEVKEIWIDQLLWKYYCILGQIWAKQTVVRFVPNAIGESEGLCHPRKFCYFHSHLILETVFQALKLTQNCYIIMNISFSWKLVV